MAEDLLRKQQELVEIIKQHSPQTGKHPTAIPSLSFMRQNERTQPAYGMHTLSLCIVVQGKKEVWLAQDRYSYGPGDYLVATVDLPISGQVIEASPTAPYLALKLEFNMSQVLEMIAETHTSTKDANERAMYVSHLTPSLMDGVLRLARLVITPDDIPVLAPLIQQEILYRLLQEPYGNTLAQVALSGSSTYRIAHVIQHVLSHYQNPIRIEELADIAKMSVATLHRHFKEVTAMSPIQFQKQLRLQEARRLLFVNEGDALDVAFQVGYESPSQFSREYSRMFGLPPMEDVNRMRKQLSN